MKKVKRWQKHEDEILKKYYKKKTHKEIGDMLNRTALAIENRAKRLGIRKRSKYHFDKKYFEKINTPEKAYWLGFIYADGAVVHNSNNRSYEVNIELQKGDKNHLVKFNQALSGNYSVTEGSRAIKFSGQEEKVYHSALIRIYSKDLVESLITQQVGVRKSTQHENFPCLINEKLQMAFIMGVFDGDGTAEYNAEIRSRSRINIVSVNYEFLLTLQNFLEKLQIRAGITISHSHQKQILYRLNIKGMSSLKLFCQYYLQLQNTTLERKRKVIKLINIAL